MHVRVPILAALTASALACTGAVAQDASLLHPQMEVDLSAPQYFDGLYAGVIFGAEGNDYFNIFSGTATDRFGAGAALGWNTYLTPSVVAGAQARTLISSDFTTNHGYDAFALARLGVLTADDFMVYAAAGPGLVDGVPVFAFGQGLEWRAWDNITANLEVLGIAQVGTRAGGAFIEGVTAWSITSGLLWHFGEGSQDLEGPGFIMAPLDQRMDFSGLYAGTEFGVMANFPYNFFPDTGHGLHLTRADTGGMVGWNAYLSDYLLVGAELQAGMLWDTSGDVTRTVLGLGRVGVQPMDRLVAYTAGGAGLVQDRLAFALGGGVEYALWDNASVRAEMLGLGELSTTPTVAGFSASKLTFGVLWHLN